MDKAMWPFLAPRADVPAESPPLIYRSWYLLGVI